MKPKSFAEKIVIYISPFVFNCILNILIYDSENNFIEEKTIGVNNPEFQINLLYRKTHYDIYYEKQFYEKYSDKLNILMNYLENILYLNSQTTEEFLIENNNNINIEKKEDIQNKENNIINKGNKEDIQNKENKNINKENKNKEYKDKNKKEEENYIGIYFEQDKYNSPLCLRCQNHNKYIENEFWVCNDCLLIILKEKLFLAYIEYIKRDQEYIRNKDNLQSFLQNKKCNIYVQDDVSLTIAIYNSGCNLSNLLLDIKKNVCLFCCNNINENNFYLELACQCRICKKECFDEYFQHIEKKSKLFENKENKEMGFHSLYCICGFKYDFKSLVYMIHEMSKQKLKIQKETYIDFLLKYCKWKCAMCGENFNRQFKYFRINFKDDNIDKKILKKIGHRHLICQTCADFYNIFKNKSIVCQFCHSKHIIKEIKSVDENNEVEDEDII